MDMDTRLEAYREAAAAMRRGDFRADIPVDPPDEVGALGCELRELEHSLERRFAEFQRLIRLNGELNSGMVLEDVLETVYASFKGVIPYDRIGFALLEDGGKTLRAHWAKMEYSYPCLTKGFSAPMAGSSLEPLLKSGRPRILNDLRDHLAAHPGSESTRLMVREGVLSSLTCPLTALGKHVGFLFFSSRFAKTYEDAHVGTFLSVAATVSTVIEKSRLYDELVALGRVKNAFLGMAAHDLRGPLANIVSYVELLQAGVVGEGPERAAALADMARIAEGALTMVESLLDVTAIESGTLKLARRPVALGEFLERVRAHAALAARAKGGALDLVVAPDAPAEFVMDADRVEQALLNLLSNAFKFSRPGTRVLLMAKPLAGGGLSLGVHDEGPGISDSARQRLFRDFARGEASPTGAETSTGLGLAIVRRIAEAHGGEVSVVSSPGKGSVFVLTLPPAP